MINNNSDLKSKNSPFLLRSS